MIPVLDRYELLTPASLSEALDDLARHPQARPFAGGTDLMVLLEAGHLPPGRYVSLAQCPELLGIMATDHGAPAGDRSVPSGVSIGARVTYTEIRDSALLGASFPLLATAAAETGGIATQNRGTIGGNIANASPAADTPPVLLVYDAELELLSSAGARRVPYASFHRGYKQMDLRPGEIIARVYLPTAGRGTEFYRKVGTRRAQAISKVCFAGRMAVEDGHVQDVRIALGSVAPTVIRAVRTEAAVRGRALGPITIAAACDALASEIAPIDDIRSSARYRVGVAVNLLRQFLTATA